MNKMMLGENIRIARNRRGYLLKDVSASTGISISHLSDIENGRTNPSIKTLDALASYLQTPISELLGEEKMNKKFYVDDRFCVNIDDISSIEPRNPADPEYPFNLNFIGGKKDWTINKAFRKHLIKFIEDNNG